MNPTWLSLLRCPYCRQSLRFDETPRPPEGVAEFGILRCECSAFPVVDGIPIVQRGTVGMFEHTTGATEVVGPEVTEVVRLIEDGRPLEALLECLAFPVIPVPIRRKLPWRVVNSRRAQRLARFIGKRQLRTELLSRRQAITARELLDFFYRPGRPLAAGVGHYFLLRFCQPRHLAALALVATIPASDKPVLDIAGGVGHLEHYLTERRDPLAVVGTDMNFFHVWIARHWIAPAGRFVCANAQDGLPFDDDVFSATLCSDAYHYIPNRRDLQSEIERCAPKRPVLLTRVGNRAVMPNEGLELTGQAYLDEFGATGVQMFAEVDLLKSYLGRKNPLTQPAEDPLKLADAKWLSFAWNISAHMRGAVLEDGAWPHAVGQVGLNPIYAATASANGDLQLRFDFPHAWYAYENHDMLSYHPRTAAVTRDQIEDRARWREDPSLSALVRSFVLIGLPSRF